MLEGDTIPASLKSSLFSGREAPDLGRDYDVIGFDADHCLVKYNIPLLSALKNQMFGKDLFLNFSGYPE